MATRETKIIWSLAEIKELLERKENIKIQDLQMMTDRVIATL